MSESLITEQKQAEEQTRRNLERIRALHEIDKAITSTLDLRTILDVLLETIGSFFSYPSTSTIRLLNKETGTIDPLAAWHIDEEEWKSERQETPHGHASAVIDTKASVVIRNLLTDPRSWNTKFYLKHGLVSYLGVPLIAHGKVLGVLGFYTKDEHEFTNEEASRSRRELGYFDAEQKDHLMAIARQMGIALALAWGFTS